MEKTFIEWTEKNPLIFMSTSSVAVGISKISIKLFREMLVLYESATYNWLNYKYFILKCSKIYPYPVLM